MNTAAQRPGKDLLILAVRCVVGGIFVTMGLMKALQPVDFLRLLREFDVVGQPLLMNGIAATLPWFEVMCGLLLCLGVAVRGTALGLVIMLVIFTGMVLRRALALHETSGVPFCAIRFDCGCGTGEVLICRKLVENTLLTLGAAILVGARSTYGALRHRLF
ncbi:MAG: DoxX family protein [Opitutaceae bacterium]|nr:DoxX family protein [Opitutaceae bacterium]